MVRALGLRNVTFAGRVEPAAIRRYYDAADIYVQTSSIDHLPLSVLEACASGLPIVATAVGGVPAMLEHGITGRLIADDDDEALAREVLWILEHPEDARTMAERARESLARYEWPAVREKWLGAYRAAMDRRASRAQRDQWAHVR
jgi:phenylacetate-CoA ligase